MAEEEHEGQAKAPKEDELLNVLLRLEQLPYRLAPRLERK